MSLIDNPKSCFKYKLRSVLNRIPIYDFQEVCNRIISDVRSIDIDSAKRKKILRKNEVILILQEFGELEPKQQHRT